jgi:hypothetical protein
MFPIVHYKKGLLAKKVGAKALSMNVATIPPGGVAYAHIHVGFEVAGRREHRRRFHLHRARHPATVDARRAERRPRN